jgi:hypothetical protein
MLEQAIAVAAHEIDLMLAAFLEHRLDVVDGVDTRQFGGEFSKQMGLGSRAIDPFLSREGGFFQGDPLDTTKEIHNPLVRLADQGLDHRRLVRLSLHFGQLCHVKLPAQITSTFSSLMTKASCHVELRQSDKSRLI